MRLVGTMLEPPENHAASCGLYCNSCRYYIATTRDPELKNKLAKEKNTSVERVTCYGCQNMRLYGMSRLCEIKHCVQQNGVQNCFDCEYYPCDSLKDFKSRQPNRIELFENLRLLKSVGIEEWHRLLKHRFSCPDCGAVNSAYDYICRECGHTPSCPYVEENIEEITRRLETEKHVAASGLYGGHTAP